MVYKLLLRCYIAMGLWPVPISVLHPPRRGYATSGWIHPPSDSGVDQTPVRDDCRTTIRSHRYYIHGRTAAPQQSGTWRLDRHPGGQAETRTPISPISTDGRSGSTFPVAIRSDGGRFAWSDCRNGWPGQDWSSTIVLSMKLPGVFLKPAIMSRSYLRGRCGLMYNVMNIKLPGIRVVGMW